MARFSSVEGVVLVLFLGTHTPKLDDKGRLFLPAKFRDRLTEGGLVITRGQERCLYVYPRATEVGRESFSTSLHTL